MEQTPLTQTFTTVASLIAIFLTQTGLVAAGTAFLKEAFNLEGTKTRLASFVIGGVLGGLILWAHFATRATASALPVDILMSFVFLLGSALTASGYYDYKKITSRTRD